MHSWAEECDTVTLWQLSESGLRRSSRLVSQLSCIYGTMTGNTCLGMKTSPSSSPSTWSSSSQSSKIRSPALLDLWQWHQDSGHMFGSSLNLLQKSTSALSPLNITNSYTIVSFSKICFQSSGSNYIVSFKTYIGVWWFGWWWGREWWIADCLVSNPLRSLRLPSFSGHRVPRALAVKIIIIIIFSGLYHHHLHQQHHHVFWWRERCLCSSLWPTTKALSQILWCKRSMRLVTVGQ